MVKMKPMFIVMFGINAGLGNNNAESGLINAKRIIINAK